MSDANNVHVHKHTLATFLKRVREVHGNKFGYTKSVYVTSHSKITEH
jgi:hypothetical protein